MATKTFSGRADTKALAYADSITKEQFGMSFGQYCSSLLIEAVQQGATLPQPQQDDALSKKARALKQLKALVKQPHNEEIGKLSDSEVKDLIAARYA